jgi:hypothetical protein
VLTQVPARPHWVQKIRPAEMFGLRLWTWPALAQCPRYVLRKSKFSEKTWILPIDMCSTEFHAWKIWKYIMVKYFKHLNSSWVYYVQNKNEQMDLQNYEKIKKWWMKSISTTFSIAIPVSIGAVKLHVCGVQITSTLCIFLNHQKIFSLKL